MTDDTGKRGVRCGACHSYICHIILADAALLTNMLSFATFCHQMLKHKRNKVVYIRKLALSDVTVLDHMIVICRSACTFAIPVRESANGECSHCKQTVSAVVHRSKLASKQTRILRRTRMGHLFHEKGSALVTGFCRIC